jgi:hypothetical protein
VLDHRSPAPPYVVSIETGYVPPEPAKLTVSQSVATLRFSTRVVARSIDLDAYAELLIGEVETGDEQAVVPDLDLPIEEQPRSAKTLVSLRLEGGVKRVIELVHDLPQERQPRPSAEVLRSGKYLLRRDEVSSDGVVDASLQRLPIEHLREVDDGSSSVHGRLAMHHRGESVNSTRARHHQPRPWAPRDVNRNRDPHGCRNEERIYTQQPGSSYVAKP